MPYSQYWSISLKTIPDTWDATVINFMCSIYVQEWRLGPTLLTLCEHLFVSFIIRLLRKQSGNVMSRIKWKEMTKAEDGEKAGDDGAEEPKVVNLVWNKWGIGKFVLSGIVAYIDGRLCRNIPHPLARRIVSGFLLSFLDQSDDGTK